MYVVVSIKDNLLSDTLPQQKLIELQILTISLLYFPNEWLGEF